MIIAHLPAAYLLSRLLFARCAASALCGKTFVLAGVLGGLAPDLDMVYFYLVDHRQHHHHTYFTHFPVLWAGLLAVSLAWIYLVQAKTRALLAMVFALNGLFHLLLDSVVGDIWWLAPWLDRPFSLFTVRARYQPWWLNFLLHWSFVLELMIVLWAALLWRRAPSGVIR